MDDSLDWRKPMDKVYSSRFRSFLRQWHQLGKLRRVGMGWVVLFSAMQASELFFIQKSPAVVEVQRVLATGPIWDIQFLWSIVI